VQQQASEVAQSQLQAQQVRLAQLELSSERVGEALATTGDALPVLVRQASELGAQRTEVLKTIAKLTQQIATFEPDFFDDAYFRSIIEILYLKTPDAMKLRAECNQRLLRAVTRIWLWPNDMALVQYRDAPGLQAIPLPTKKAGDTHTYFLKHLQGLLAPPV
jgi:hypothetical protein